VTGSVACSTLSNLTCGGDNGNYGDAVSFLKAANRIWLNYSSTSTPARGGF